MTEFRSFGKIPRLSRECTITEKIDGTNACIFIGEDGEFLTGCRTRWITPEDDNHGFARWAHEHKDELLNLGPGRHFGEWWGAGIQRKYGLDHKRFSLFNTSRWADANPYPVPFATCPDTLPKDVAFAPACCRVVPVIYHGLFDTDAVNAALMAITTLGSAAAPGFMQPEGIIIYHHASGGYFKKILEHDDEWKGKRV